MGLLARRNQSPDLLREFFGDDPFMGLTLFPEGRGREAFPDSFSPAMDVSEEKDRIVVRADLPGLKKDEIDVSYDNGFLTIKGERRSEKEDKDKRYHRVERVYGAFQRSIQIGTQVDTGKVSATYKDGVLELVVPKKPDSQAQRIQILDK